MIYLESKPWERIYGPFLVIPCSGFLSVPSLGKQFIYQPPKSIDPETVPEKKNTQERSEVKYVVVLNRNFL